MELTLYQRDTCHLCDLALAVLAEARVPVLRDAGRDIELDWPFDVETLHDFLGAR